MASSSSDPVRRPAGLEGVVSLAIGVLSFGLSIPTSVLIARAVGPSGKGVVTLVGVLVSQLGTFLSLGIETASIHFTARRKLQPRAVAGAALGISAVIGPLGALLGIVGLTFLFSDALTEAGVVPWAYATMATIPVIIVAQYLRALLVGAGRIVESSMLVGISSVLGLAAAVIAASSGLGVSGLLALNIAAAGLGTIATVAVCLRSSLLPPGPLIDRSAQKALLGYGIKGHIGHLLSSLNFRLDVFIAAAVVSTGQLGVYSIAITMAESLWLFPRFLGAIVMQRAAALPGEEGRRVTGLAVRLTAVALLLLGVVIGVLAGPLIQALFGTAFGGAVKPLVILLPGAWGLAIWKTVINDLDGRGHPEYKSYTSAIAVLITAVLGAYLIPRHGITGAATTTTVAYFSALFAALAGYRRLTGTSLEKLLVPRWGDFRDLRESIVASFRYVRRKPPTPPVEQELVEAPSALP